MYLPGVFEGRASIPLEAAVAGVPGEGSVAEPMAVTAVQARTNQEQSCSEITNNVHVRATCPLTTGDRGLSAKKCNFFLIHVKKYLFADS